MMWTLIALANKRMFLMHICSPEISSLWLSPPHCLMTKTHLIHGSIYELLSHWILYFENLNGRPVWFCVEYRQTSRRHHEVLITLWSSKWIKIKSAWNYHTTSPQQGPMFNFYLCMTTIVLDFCDSNVITGKVLKYKTKETWKVQTGSGHPFLLKLVNLFSRIINLGGISPCWL